MEDSHAEDSREYIQKKSDLKRILTIYGRKPVLEALENKTLHPSRLHLADSNKPCKILADIEAFAKKRGVEIRTHNKKALSRISKNGKQDQGIALDITCEQFQSFEQFLEENNDHYSLIALDNVTNPQNVGMIIRSVCASPMTALLLPEKGGARLDALVIKASAGTLFKARIVRCERMLDTLKQLKSHGANIIGLDGNATNSLKSHRAKSKTVYVLGNETEGLSDAVRETCNETIAIPMANGVESLNVSIAASLIAFRSVF